MKKLLISLSFGVSLLANAYVNGSSETTFALLEPPNVETQLNRIDIGINVIRINNVLLNDVPISADATWIDNIINPPKGTYMAISRSPLMTDDPFYTTVGLSNTAPGLKSLAFGVETPITSSFFEQIIAIYKNPFNTKGERAYKFPDVHAFANVLDPSTFTSFPEGKEGELIEVQAIRSRLYKNISEAVLELCSLDDQDELKEARANYQESVRQASTIESRIASLQAWINDRKNSSKSGEKEEKKEEIGIKEVELDRAKTKLEQDKDIYEEVLKKAADTIDDNIDVEKIPLAKKINALLQIISSNTAQALSMFGAATLSFTKNGFNTLDQEIAAITWAMAITKSKQKHLFLEYRMKRLLVNSVLAIPNIAAGIYQASAQSFEVDYFEKITSAYVKAGKILEKETK